MPVPAVPRRLLLLVPLLLLVLLAVWATRSGSEAAPPQVRAGSTSQAGKISFDSFPGGVTATLPLRSFSVGGSSGATAGGGGSGKFTADNPTAVLDASAVDPLLLRAVATGIHLSKVSVTLYRPGTTDRLQVWDFADVSVGDLHTTQSGSAKPPRVSLGLRYARVTLTTYDARGAVVRSLCFDLAGNTICS